MYGGKHRKKPVINEPGWTVDDYYQLPEDGNQYEIINGILELKPSPSTTHQRISHRLERTLTDSCENNYIITDSPIDVILSDMETRQPDILMIHRSRERIIQEHAIVGPPDLVIEILSRNSANRDRIMKKESYARFGVPEYWIVDYKNEAVEQYVPEGDKQQYDLINVFEANDTITSDRLPCVSFIVKDGLKI
ncbi:Endonuclease, Uma2 family (restriction endonuclease fold) [Lentibacillus halodurans]|uniref:Endonuclease, Uma2 family (Restriction endonuclease fold) n=1 Tax=Lentibacillus halodurans TaxID=237679 RepID=A0A1I1A575_9BACI|nr:Uma2 family endonuclease [Lentibacillus halodurans]SFB32516.1 Endonuclease, Uma2 family (restriction endonuclease fold) [Lentibacillus halodurans]